MSKRKIEDGLEPLGVEMQDSAVIEFALKVCALAAAGLLAGLAITYLV